MGEHRFTDLQAFASEGPGFLADLVRNVAREIHRELHDATRSAVEALIPVRTGALKAKVHDDPSSPQAAIDALQPTAVVVDDSDKAWILNRGRKKSTKDFRVRGKHGSYTVKAGKMLGSEMAPRGIRGPAIRKVRQLEDQLVEAAISKAESSS